MRLTLRTMLAYLDDILEPNDAQGLEQKIEESKFASDLVHRIRSSTRRLRLGAPKVDGKGMADDANTVAEYLDNVKSMTAEKILEFEKVCLESDVHLAEVASAHQILTHVLREPAQINESLREKVYRFGYGEPSAAPPVASTESREPLVTDAEPPIAADVTPASLSATASNLDDQSAMSRGPVVVGRPNRQPLPLASLAVTLLLGFVLAIVALRAMGELGPNHPVLRFFVGSRTDGGVAQAPTNDGQAAQEVVGGNSGEKPTEAAEASTSSDSTSSTTEKGVGVAASETTGESEAATSKLEATAPTEASDATEANSTERPATLPVPGPVDSAADKTSPLVSEPTEASKTIENPAEAPVPAVGVDPLPDATTTPPAAIGDANAPASPITAGRFLSEEQIIAKWDDRSGSWAVLPPDSALLAGDQVLSLPTFRPQVVVAPSVKVTLAGESLMRLNAPDAANVSRFTLDWGRATMIPVGDMVGSLSIDAGGRSGSVTFADVESAAAIDVRVFLPPGADPFKDPPHLAVQLWATSGGIDWEEQGRAPVHLNAGQLGILIDDGEMKVTDGNLPDWIDGRNLSEIERRASQEMRKFLTPDRPLSLSLMELTDYRQVEVRSVACRSLCYLDIYEPALESLGNQQHRSYWHTHLDALRTRIGHGEPSAAKLRATVDKLYNDQADLVFRLLAGYSPEQLGAGGAKELVEELTNSSMAVRVLAYENLRRITGKTQLFRPEERPEQEKPKVLKWRKLLDEGQIGYKDDAGQ